jgi:methylase of polypeptide subunit release factors
VALYPTEGILVASDKHSNLNAVAEGTPADIVYSALTSETHRFVKLMPRVPCEDYLELCSGTGIAALVAARSFARRAWAVDITERSTRFARFNAALNGLSNVSALAGDLYAPVAGRTFDVISAHPPYVPSPEQSMVFRDGGEDGEQITRRIIGGLAAHLRPGGQFYCDCVMTDRRGAPLEQRIREMLGPAHEEFDVLLGTAGTFDGDGYLARLAQAQKVLHTRPESELSWHRALIDRLEIERFVNAAFLIRRRLEPRPVFTRRRAVSPETGPAHYQWYMRWAAAAEGWPDAPPILDAPVRRVERTELRSRSVCGPAGWTVVDASLATRTPFACELRCPTWLASLLARCDGVVTVRDHLRHFRDIGVIPTSATDGEFALLIAQLADGGFIELDDFRLPSLDDGVPS